MLLAQPSKRSVSILIVRIALYASLFAIFAYMSSGIIGKQVCINGSAFGILLSCLFYQLQPRFGHHSGFGCIEHRAFRDGDDGVVVRERELELRHGWLEVMLTVRETAAANHQVAQTGEIRLADMLVAVTDLLHRHAGQGHRTVEEGLQRCRHAVTIERKTEHQQVAVQDFLQNRPHIVVVDTGAAIALASEASHAVFDMFVDNMNQLYLLFRHLIHAFQEGSGNVQSVAFLPFGATIKNKDSHNYNTKLRG